VFLLLSFLLIQPQQTVLWSNLLLILQCHHHIQRKVPSATKLHAAVRIRVKILKLWYLPARGCGNVNGCEEASSASSGKADRSLDILHTGLSLVQGSIIVYQSRSTVQEISWVIDQLWSSQGQWSSVLLYSLRCTQQYQCHFPKAFRHLWTQFRVTIQTCGC